MDVENKYGVIKALEELRQKFNLTKTDVAEMTGLHARTLFDTLNGQRSLTKNKIGRASR